MSKTLKKAIGLSALAGLRTSVPPAVISHYKSNHHDPNLSGSKLGFIQSNLASVISKLLSTAEVSADKMPGAPNRIILSQTLPRVASGALIGAVICQAGNESWVKGVFIGGISALAATYASFYARKNLKKVPYLTDPIVGFAEDMFVLKGSKALMKS